MANPRTKGKIPHGEWPRFLAKYAGGETIAQIGRDYGCTAPAIRYIISRSERAKGESGGEGLRRRASSSGAPSGRNRTVSAAALSHLPSPASHRTSASVLGPQLLTRVTGDVVSFLAALDHAVLEGTPESLGVLQGAIDALMRSAARTRIELGRIVNRDEAAAPHHDGAARTDKSLLPSE
jgi:hypothetical protein